MQQPRVLCVSKAKKRPGFPAQCASVAYTLLLQVLLLLLLLLLQQAIELCTHAQMNGSNDNSCSLI
jgi:hypothetical protein